MKKSLHLISNISRKFRDDHVGAYAGQATLFIIISLFPFLMFLLTLIQFLPITESNIMIIVDEIFPTNLSPMFIGIISEVFDKGTTTVISVTAITALWSASRGFLTIAKGLNNVYGIKETRNYILTRISATLYTLVFAVIIVITLIFLVFGNRIYYLIENLVPILKDAALLVISLRAVVGFAILVVFFLLLYLAVPNRKGKVVNELPGAIITAAGWMVFSYLYSFYIDNMANMSDTYGSLTAIVLLMLWLYFCMYILFIGAEVNVILCTKTLQKVLKAPEKYDGSIRALFNNDEDDELDVEDIVSKLPKQIQEYYEGKQNK